MKADCSTSSASAREPSIRTANRVHVSRYRWDNTPNDSTSPPSTSAISWASDPSLIDRRLRAATPGSQSRIIGGSRQPQRSNAGGGSTILPPSLNAALAGSLLWGCQRQNDRHAVDAGSIQRPVIARLEIQRSGIARGRGSGDQAVSYTHLTLPTIYSV